MLLVLNLPWSDVGPDRHSAFPILGPLILFCSVVGTYSIRFLIFDVWVMFVFGIGGYFMRKFGYLWPRWSWPAFWPRC